MHLTNNGTIKILSDNFHDANYLVHVLSVIKKLISQYGKKMGSDDMLGELKNNYSEITDVIEFLKKNNKLNGNFVKQAIIYVKSNNKNYKKSFDIEAVGQDAKTISDYLKSKFGEIEFESREDINMKGVNISGENYYYKRDIDADLAKMFG